MNYKRIVAIGAHPDDIELGCGGFLRKMHSLYSTEVSITALICSAGTHTDPKLQETREEETRTALAKLVPGIKVGYHNMFFHVANWDHLTENQVAWDVSLRRFLETWIDKECPNLVLTHSNHDFHQEHREIHEYTRIATRSQCCSLLFYQSPSVTEEFQPKMFVDLSHDDLHNKLDALSTHKSQLHRKYMQPGTISDLAVHPVARFKGIKRVESFEVGHIIF